MTRTRRAGLLVALVVAGAVGAGAHGAPSFDSGAASTPKRARLT